MNNKINRSHERRMHLIYGGKTTSFEELLGKDKSASIHARNLQILPTEIFKMHQNMSSPIFSELFHRLDIGYNFRSNSNFAVPNLKSVFHKNMENLCLFKYSGGMEDYFVRSGLKIFFIQSF